MNRTLPRILFAALMLLSLACLLRAFPVPSAYPISWELKFEHSKLNRLVITPTGSTGAQAYWYMTFTVTNPGSQERKFLPVFELLTEDGRAIRSDDHIPAGVLETIRIREHKPHLEALNDVAGTIRVGDDQARESVAIWPEPNPRMGRFSVFVGGLSGEAVILKDEKGKAVERTLKDGKKEQIVLWKTLQMEYHMAGDEKYPGNDLVDLVEQRWVMR